MIPKSNAQIVGESKVDLHFGLSGLKGSFILNILMCWWSIGGH